MKFNIQYKAPFDTEWFQGVTALSGGGALSLGDARQRLALEMIDTWHGRLPDMVRLVIETRAAQANPGDELEVRGWLHRIVAL